MRDELTKPRLLPSLDATLYMYMYMYLPYIELLPATQEKIDTRSVAH